MVHNFILDAVAELSGTDGLQRPNWSPDGQFIVAWLGRDLLLYSVENKDSNVLLEDVRYEYVSWSGDSGSLFLVDSFWAGSERSVHRLNIEDGSLRKVAQIGKERSAWGTDGRWIGVKKDGTPLLLRDHSIHNIYALEWNLD